MTTDATAQASATGGTATVCGADSQPTLKGQAMIITGKNVVLEVCHRTISGHLVQS
jgi:hypothetical protein